MIEPGTKNGDTLRTPPAAKSSQVFSIIGRPPIPEPIDTPIRSGAGLRFEPGVAYGLNARRHAVMDEDIHAARFFDREVLANIEIPHFTSDLHGKAGNIETGDPVNTRNVRQ
jgi:hypothetical protein